MSTVQEVGQIGQPHQHGVLVGPNEGPTVGQRARKWDNGGETMTGQRQHIRAEGGRGPCVACGAARGARGDCVARWVRERVGGPREAVRGYAGPLEVSEGAGRPDGLQ